MESYLWEGAIVPEVTFVGEAVADKSNLALLDVLLDRVKSLLLGDLVGEELAIEQKAGWQRHVGVTAQGIGCIIHLHLRIGPSWHLNNHVENGLLRIGIQRDIMEGRHRFAILLDKHAILEGIRRADAPGRVFSHVDVVWVGIGSLSVVVEVSRYVARARTNFVNRVGRGGVLVAGAASSCSCWSFSVCQRGEIRHSSSSQNSAATDSACKCTRSTAAERRLSTGRSELACNEESDGWMEYPHTPACSSRTVG